MAIIYDVTTFNNCYSNKARVVNFDDVIKIVTIFIKTSFKDSNKVKSIRNFMYQNPIYICISWYRKKLLITGEKMMASVELKEHTSTLKEHTRDLYIYFIYFRYIIIMPSWSIAGYVWQILRMGDFLPTTPLFWVALKRPILNRVIFTHKSESH